LSLSVELVAFIALQHHSDRILADPPLADRLLTCQLDAAGTMAQFVLEKISVVSYTAFF